jgi:hypothetical protein
MYGGIIPIDETLNVVCCAINNAESTLKEHVKLYYHNVNEEFITTAFYGHIKHRLCEASQNKLIEHAFLKDLKTALHSLPYHGYNPISNWELDNRLHIRAEGLIADIVLHNKRQEGKTGGDFGLLIVHPQIEIEEDGLKIEEGRTSGLLCQAKLKDKDGQWGSFTDNQQTILPKQLDFTSLVLYSYCDEQRIDLNPLAWKLCQGMSFPAIEALLKKSDLEEELGTIDVVRRLGREEIGTKDQTLIETIISPVTRQYFEIRIYRPNYNDPKETVIKLRRQQTIQQQVYARR